jgi:mannitol 2-dehydrogenase
MDSPIRLNQAGLARIGALGVPVPTYPRPLRSRIAHIGMGGFHRAHLATYVDELARNGVDWGITGLGLLEQDARMAAVMADQDGLYTVIERGVGEPRAAIVGSVAVFILAPPPRFADAAKVIADPDTAVLSMTVTEAGYGEPTDGEETTFDRLASALALRRDNRAGPLTVLSCDNLPGNGAAARRATLAAAERAGGSLPAWIEANCTFPDSMVDRITPATRDADRSWLRETFGIDDAWPIVCEPYRQWVVEDKFAAGRPPFEDVGVIFSDRVGDWELYKLRFLNAGHSAIAYLAALAGIELVDEAMRAPEVLGFLRALLLDEALPSVPEIPGYPRESYVDTVLGRFANAAIGDQIARLCVDGTAKLASFLIPTALGDVERGGSAARAATSMAGWARYLGTVDPERQAFDASAVEARRYATDALAEPVAFLRYEAVFPAELRESESFRAAFVEAYRSIAERGALAAMAHAARPLHG